MALNTQRRYTARTATIEAVDEGLRAYMLRVYNYMASALLLTGITAMVVAQSPVLTQVIFGTPLKWVVMLAPIGLVLLFSARLHTLSFGAAQAIYWGFAALMGMSLASIFLVFTGESIARVFFVTAAAFGGLSLYGYTTKKDLSGWGSFLIMGLIGIVLASLVNLFLASSALQFAVSVIGVLVFAGLTAYDTQQIKEVYVESYGEATLAKLSLMGALRLYLDFINLFVMLLHLFGSNRQ
ncbi:MAG: Bax inhibitor-1/YccA family protein [Alphaproteobacteria bacterium]|nr:Bax inhibitor-1/YccA family protein [Alphaproteobacteria bacterium]